MRKIVIAALTLLTGACDRAGETRADNVFTGEPYGNRVAALPDVQQRAVFLRAIRDAGQDCQEVTEARPGGTYRSMPVWQARCRGGGNWTIVVSDDGIAQILNANEARLVTDEAAANASEGAAR